jgi:methionyl-tRNA formyltransferase
MIDMIPKNTPLPAKPRVLFMGTPDFAVPSLRALHQWCEQQGGEVVGVVSQPDRRKGRGKKFQRTPIADVADQLGIVCHQWPKLSQQSYDTLKELNYDLAVVIAYGKILPKRYLTLPPWGCINLHASLLPAYRGAAPIQWALINGERETGVSVMRLDEGMDTGPVAHVLSEPILEEDTSASLFEKLAQRSSQALIEALNIWITSGTKSALNFIAQVESEMSHAPMLSKSDGLLEWARSASSLLNLTRGVNPWPGAQTQTKEGILKVKSLSVLSETVLDEQQVSFLPGTVIGLYKSGPAIRCGQGAVILTETQRPSKKATSGDDFYRGYPLTIGQLLIEC